MDRPKIIELILQREQLRPLSRSTRLGKAPLRTVPYYCLAALSHLKPFPLTFRTLWGTKMTSYLPEGNTFLYYGFCEANVTNFFLRYIREGMTVFDVGAHVGMYTMLASELIGESGSVHSFEPTPSTFLFLKENTASLSNVHINQKAVSDMETEITLLDYGPGYGAYNTASQHGAQGITKPGTTISVATISLDTYARQHDLSPDLLKLDAEGFESAVLKGSEELLNQTSAKRPLIILEVAGGDEWSENRQECFTLLKNANYETYTMNTDGTVSEHNYEESYVYDNLLFIPRERTEAVLTVII